MRELLRQALHRIRRRTRNRFRQVEPVALLGLAEVRGLKQLFQANDLGTLAYGFAYQSVGSLQVGGDIRRCVVLDEPDGEWLSALGSRLRAPGC